MRTVPKGYCKPSPSRVDYRCGVAVRCKCCGKATERLGGGSGVVLLAINAVFKSLLEL